ncbi:Hypothetical_protein [Hexamita inflata]|uniref:Hypothetical_protein n=1 Tax=Hexamita inflata TaxID=28002 RepID=A0AA86TMQ7_9EUKA|nr:Hypothetical protein HINF_LOCUS9676 [Hexamita inflata]
MNKVQIMIEKRTLQRQEQKDTQNTKNLILSQNKLQQARLKCSGLEQLISDKDIKLQETTYKYLTAMKQLHEAGQNQIDMQLQINQQAKELKEQQKLINQQQRLLSRAKNTEHILKYVDCLEVQKNVLFEINNIGLEFDHSFDIKNYFQSKAQAKVFYSKLIKLLEKQKGPDDIIDHINLKQEQRYSNLKLKTSLLQLSLLKYITLKDKYLLRITIQRQFKEVSRRLQLQLCLADELGVTISTKRLGTKHTNRVFIDKQLDDSEIKDLVNLADVVFKFMKGNKVDTLAFDQISDFWFTIKAGITDEWGSKKLVNQSKIIVDGHNNERAEKASRIMYSASRIQINSESVAEFVKPPKIVDENQKQRKRKSTNQKTTE